MNRLATTLTVGKTAAVFLLTSGILISAPTYAREVSQAPLLLGSGSVPGNLALVPSVEFPTVISVANLGAYTHTANYTGYFDSEKCYQYQRETINHPFFGQITGAQGGGYFTPTRKARDCSNADEWSGNYLNWATTQTIDPFRKALTGGYRVVDTTSQTIVEKATRAGRNSYFPERTVTSNLTQIAPYSGINRIRTSVSSGNEYQRNKALTVIRRAPNILGIQVETTEYFSVRVEVCKKGTNNILLESNCKQYGNNWKPEGLLQQYSDSIRYSVFSYLNQDGNTRNGGVMRAPQTYIGQITRTPGVPEQQTNSTPEWNPTTGQLVVNPYGDASGNSGVINYINKFGELSNRHKSNDPVSELYYTALRYFKNQGNVASYSNNLTDEMRDNFPVITDWSGKDPIQYACQKNVILGIGDVNSHEDRDLPAAGDNLAVNDWTQTVFDLEGISKRANATSFNGNGNSAYIAGLAYYANTTDIRSDIAGKQTISTHWVDVRENEILEGKARNQYWLAAKYGGFKVPDNYTIGTPLPAGSWRTNTDVLSSGDPRPDNFYVASDAENMVESLKLAFARIAQEAQSSTTSLASNSTRLAMDTVVFQSSLNSKYWSGDLLARKVNANGTTATSATWSASTKLNAQNINNRKIFTAAPLTNASPATNGQISTTAMVFSWAAGGLNDAQKNLLATATERDLTNAQDRLNYLRGDRSLERTDSDATKLFRQRGSRLGDIINSDPQYIANSDFGYNRLTGSTWADARAAYATFRSGNANRKPMVIVGANDGMLHGFNASMTDGGGGGEELFAFIPNGVFENLIRLTEPTYAHRYYVDGTPRISDAWIGGTWKTIVAGTTGAGGRSVFALDITDPDNMGPNKFLWEFSHPEMGNTIGQPAIVALPNGKFSVVVTTGYRTAAQTTAKVWFLDAANGSVIRTMDITTGGDLGAPLLADTNGDQIADKLYVGDTTGKLWRADISGATPGSWSAPTLMFTATDGTTAQPITAPLSSAFNEKGQHVVLFGTGSYMFIGDNEIPTTPPTQSFYGIVDAGNFPITRSNLLAQEILSESTVGDFKARTISDNSLTNQRGWYLDLAWKSSRGGPGAKGERVVSKATLRTDRVTFTTMTPSADPCAAGGTSFVMALNLSSGARLNYTYFDTNKDGNLNDSDDQGSGDNKVPVSGISDPDAGVIKGVTPLFRWLCYSGSSGAAPQCIQVPGSQRYGRNAWQEAR